MVAITIVDRKERELLKFNITSDSTTETLKEAFQQKNKKYYPSRQYFTIGLDKNRIVLKKGDKLSELSLKDGDKIYFKDLGPQIGWDTVFYIEYFGPILIHSLIYFFPQFFYWGMDIKPYTYVQTVGYLCVVAHFIKRELETKFVHRFSNDTMPAFNIFKNSGHYWLLSGVGIAYFLYHPLYVSTRSELFVNIGVALFVLMELGNLSAHITLRNLRRPGTRERGIPRGGLFELVTCANYTYEIAAWLIFSIFTDLLSAYIFLLVSGGQIALWALKKHIAMKKEFGDKAPKRKILIPFLW